MISIIWLSPLSLFNVLIFSAAATPTAERKAGRGQSAKRPLNVSEETSNVEEKKDAVENVVPSKRTNKGL